ncbi:MAG TPA: hypothetical protein VFU63_07765, partial [Ktedonobacterales bacterium]|nr:hypothetical protein [Ktedonobacterales bacterium]
MYSLIPLLTRIITGQVGSASNRMTQRVWWRFVIYFVILAAALWVAIASAYLWTAASHPGVVGLVDFVQHGGPIWLLSIPLLAIVITIVGSLPVAGRYGLVLTLQAVLFWLVLVGLASFQGGGRSELNWAAVSSFLVTLPATLFALVTGLADAPPVASPLAIFYVMYFGRLRFLRQLLASAQRFGWEFSGPEGAERAFTTGGYYGNRRTVRVVSGVSWQGTSTPEQGYWYKVTVTSPSPLPSFEISHKKLSPHLASRAATGEVGGGLRPLRFYVIPRYGHPLRDEWVQRFAQQVALGRAFVSPTRANVQLTPGGIL